MWYESHRQSLRERGQGRPTENPIVTKRQRGDWRRAERTRGKQTKGRKEETEEGGEEGRDRSEVEVMLGQEDSMY